MSWGEMLRMRMRKDVEFSMRVRRIRRWWYRLVDDAPEEIAGFVCLLAVMAFCGGLIYLYGTAKWFR